MACKIWGHSHGDRECTLSGGVGVGLLGFMNPGPSSSIRIDYDGSDSGSDTGV